MTITELRPYQLQHTTSCEEQATGAAVLHLFNHGWDELTRDEIETTAAEMVSTGKHTCDCIKLRLLHAETMLDRARKGLWAATTHPEQYEFPHVMERSARTAVNAYAQEVRALKALQSEAQARH